MNSRIATERLIWLVNRLSCMPPGEVLYRFGQSCMKLGVKRGLLRTAMPAPSRPVSTLPIVSPCCSGISATPYLNEADSILNGNVILFSDRKFNVGSPPQWNRDPLTGVVSPRVFGSDLPINNRARVGDIKHVWELNRHLHLMRLAQAYNLSGEQRYLAGLADQIRSWLEQCPPLIGPNWTSSLELAIRLINWSLIWQMLGGWDGVLFRRAGGAQLREQWLESIFAHCQFICRNFSRYSSANNHLIGELAGLYVAAVSWPYWNHSARWAAQAKKELEYEAIAQHYEDGVYREQAFAYQIFAAELLITAGFFGQRVDNRFSNEFWSVLGKSLRFLRSVADVADNLPMVGDADDGMVFRFEPGIAKNRFITIRAMSEAIFGEGEKDRVADSARWLVGSAASLPKPETFASDTNWYFPDGGYFLFGSDFGKRDEIKGMVDCGPLGYLGIGAHGHADALAITLSVCGEECLVDPGTFSYWNDLKWRDYFRGTSAHNTMRVDEQNQSVSGGRFMWIRKAKASVHRTPLSPGQFDFIGSHDGYLRLADPVRHVRCIRYDDLNQHLTVKDTIKCARRHRIEQFWHFAPHLDVKLTATSAVVTGMAFILHIDFYGDGLAVEMHHGSEDPILGWYSRTYESREPSTTLKVRARSGAVSVEARLRIELFPACAV